MGKLRPEGTYVGGFSKAGEGLWLTLTHSVPCFVPLGLDFPGHLPRQESRDTSVLVGAEAWGCGRSWGLQSTARWDQQIRKHRDQQDVEVRRPVAGPGCSGDRRGARGERLSGFPLSGPPALASPKNACVLTLHLRHLAFLASPGPAGAPAASVSHTSILLTCQSEARASEPAREALPC